MQSKVWVVLVNWRNAADTVACLDSLVQCADPAVNGVVVVDNGSGDGSAQALMNWAERNSLPLSESHMYGEWETAHACSARCSAPAAPFRFVHLASRTNLGFAGGNNLGIKFVYRFEACDALLCLNNDTLATAGAVTAMLRRMSDAAAGMCGATVVYWCEPQRIQALGGSRYWPWLGKARHIGVGSALDAARDAERVERQLDYVLGAALMISRRCLEDIGLMEESYFLYFEEIDWAVRARRRGWRLAYAPDAVIYHKEGGSIGSSTVRARRSYLSEYYLLRSRMAFTRKAYPYWLPTVFAYSMIQLLRNVVHGDFARVRVQWAALSGTAFKPVKARP